MTEEQQRLLDFALQFERKWDRRMAGTVTRAYRELLGYAGGRLIGLGADPTNVVAYFHELITHIADQAGVPYPLLGDDKQGGSA